MQTKALKAAAQLVQRKDQREVLQRSEKRVTRPTTYTRAFVAAEVATLFDELSADDTIIYKGQLIENRPYSLQRFSDWAQAFRQDRQISETIAKIDDILQTRAVVGGLRNKLNPAILKFHLINNYGWRDKTEVEQTTTHFDVVDYVRAVEERNGRMRE